MYLYMYIYTVCYRFTFNLWCLMLISSPLSRGVQSFGLNLLKVNHVRCFRLFHHSHRQTTQLLKSKKVRFLFHILNFTVSQSVSQSFSQSGDGF